MLRFQFKGKNTPYFEYEGKFFVFGCMLLQEL